VKMIIIYMDELSSNLIWFEVISKELSASDRNANQQYQDGDDDDADDDDG
jgi:hypothetical protein